MDLELADKEVFARHLKAGPRPSANDLLQPVHVGPPLPAPVAGGGRLSAGGGLPEGGAPFGLPPAGAGDKLQAALALCADLARPVTPPACNVVGEALARELEAMAAFRAAF